MSAAISPYDASPASPAPPALERAHGRLHLVLGTRAGRTVLHRLRQEGCLKARFPRPAASSPVLEAVLLNLSGGIASADRLDIAVELLAGEAAMATQAAERLYRAPPGGAPAHLRTRLAIAAGARLEWLPQETILFHGAKLDRALTVSLAPGAHFLGAETLVFGRAAMGETMRAGSLRDLIRLEQAGTPLLHDALRLAGDIAAHLARPALARGATALTTLLAAGPEAEARLPALRAALAAAPEGVEAAASARPGLLLARLLAPTAAAARATLLPALAVLRETRPLPRVWLC